MARASKRPKGVKELSKQLRVQQGGATAAPSVAVKAQDVQKEVNHRALDLMGRVSESEVEANRFAYYKSSEWIPIRWEDIAPDPEQPRKYFDDEKLRRLAASIEKWGLRKPVTVRKDEKRAGKWVLIDGERRWRAIGLLVKEGRSDGGVKAILEDGDKTSVRVHQAIADLHHESYTAIEYARLVRELEILIEGLTGDKVGANEVAEFLQVDPRTVQRYRRLLTGLSEDEQEVVVEVWPEASLTSLLDFLSAMDEPWAKALSAEDRSEILATYLQLAQQHGVDPQQVFGRYRAAAAAAVSRPRRRGRPPKVRLDVEVSWDKGLKVNFRVPPTAMSDQLAEAESKLKKLLEEIQAMRKAVSTPV